MTAPATSRSRPEREAHPTHGVVHWITGLPCVGKTTVGEALVRRMRGEGLEPVLLDGDVVRRTFREPLGYSPADRRVAARRYGDLSRGLAAEGRHVVVCTVSMFDEVWRWNRAHLPRYLEVLLVAPPHVCEARDEKGVYRGKDVPGRDLAVDEPVAADLRLDNDGRRTPSEVAERIWRASPLFRSGETL